MEGKRGGEKVVVWSWSDSDRLSWGLLVFRAGLVRDLGCVKNPLKIARLNTLFLLPFYYTKPLRKKQMFFTQGLGLLKNLGVFLESQHIELDIIFMFRILFWY
jgi:hypothetical protein